MRPLRLLFWACLAATLAVYMTMLFWSLPRIAEAAGGLLPLDLRPWGYSAEEALAFLGALTPAGREFYRNTQHVLDSVYPPLLAVTLALAFHLLVPKRRKALRAILIALPFVASAFDILENARVAGLLAMPVEEVGNEAVSAASFASIAKAVLSTISFVALLAALAAGLYRRWPG